MVQHRQIPGLVLPVKVREGESEVVQLSRAEEFTRNAPTNVMLEIEELSGWEAQQVCKVRHQTGDVM